LCKHRLQRPLTAAHTPWDTGREVSSASGPCRIQCTLGKSSSGVLCTHQRSASQPKALPLLSTLQVLPSSTSIWRQQAGDLRGISFCPAAARQQVSFPTGHVCPLLFSLCFRTAKTHTLAWYLTPPGPGPAMKALSPSHRHGAVVQSMAHTAILQCWSFRSFRAAACNGSQVKTSPLPLWCPGSLGLQAARIWKVMPRWGHAMFRVWLLRECLKLPLEKQQQPAPWPWGRDEEQATDATSSLKLQTHHQT